MQREQKQQIQRNLFEKCAIYEQPTRRPIVLERMQLNHKNVALICRLI